MKKAFSFDLPAEDAVPQQHEIDINGEVFELTPDVSGIELLNLAGGATTLSGLSRLFSRAIKDADWERFVKLTDHCSVRQFGEMATGIINLYTDFPTTAVADS